MDISIGSYKCRLEIVLIIIFLLIVLFGHTMCACSSGYGGLLEGLDNMEETDLQKKEKEKEMVNNGNMEEAKLEEEVIAKEGFSNYKTNAGPQFASTSTSFSFLNPDTWSQASLVYTAGTAPSAAVKSIWDRGKNQAPLAEGEMDVFANTEFKPECCPNTYSNSEGCACMSTQQYDTLISRGGNNVPYSEY